MLPPGTGQASLPTHSGSTLRLSTCSLSKAAGSCWSLPSLEGSLWMPLSSAATVGTTSAGASNRQSACMVRLANKGEPLLNDGV